MTATGRTSRAIALLTAQAMALGLTIAWITVPGSALFLERFGAEMLPVTYIGAAVAGGLASVLLGRALRSRALAPVVVRVVLAVTVVLAVLAVALGADGASWLSFGVLIVLPLMVPVGFMFVVGQAGMLLDVRVMKATYPRVIAGFALGFTIGGLIAPLLISVLGGTSRLFGAAAVAAAALLALVLVTIRAFPSELSTVEAPEEDGEITPIGALRTNRLVLLLTVFQMLSALESQWLDYLLFERAAARYPDTEELAAFVGRFAAVTYGLDIVILLLVAGALIKKYGLRLGLSANPFVLLVLVTTTVVASAAVGSGATLVFFLVVAARMSDLVLSDGATRTSVSATYQAMPHRLRTAAQTLVESLAVPLAIGLSGVALLVIQATIGTDGSALLFAALPVIAAWIVTAFLVYREYRVNLFANLRHRTLEPGELDVSTPGVAEVVERLLSSEDVRDVRLGLTATAGMPDSDEIPLLVEAAHDASPAAFRPVLERLADLDPVRAVEVALPALRRPEPAARAAAIEVLARVGGEPHRDVVAEHLHDEDPAVSVAAAAGVSWIGTDDHRDELARLLDDHAASADHARRLRVAQIYSVAASGPVRDRAHLTSLLDDEHPDVQVAALDALRWPDDADLVPVALVLLSRRPTAEAAFEGLVRGGAAVVPLLDDVLAESPDPRQQADAVRDPCRAIGGPEAAAVLRRHAEHLDRDVGLAAIRALGEVEPATTADPARRSWASGILTDDLGHAAHTLAALTTLADRPGSELLRSALLDEVALMRERILALLALQHGSVEISRVEFQLAQSDVRVVALALEWLDTTVSGSDRLALGLLDPTASTGDRAKQVLRIVPVVAPPIDELLVDLIADPVERWRRGWIRACAVFAAVEMGELQARDTLVHLPDGARATDELVGETILGLSRRGGDAGGVVEPAI